MKYLNALIAALMLLVFTGTAMGAELSAEEVQKLGTTLTAIGAEKAGNKDGSIPTYTGGLATIPPGVKFKKGDQLRPDPFAEEKPLFTITQKNMDQYLDKLHEGNKTLLKEYPDYRMDVYKTHRTAAYPEWVYQNTIRQAGKAKLLKDGLNLTDVHAAMPFPIPKNGLEAIWNHLVRFGPKDQMTPSTGGFMVTSAGRPVCVNRCQFWESSPFWDNTKSTTAGGVYGRLRYDSHFPPRVAGEKTLFYGTLDYSAGTRAWQYLPGQRRVKLAPDFSFDTPMAQLNGGITYDQFVQFSGSPERYDWKLVGKKELYIPYNTYKLHYFSTDEERWTAKFLNPALVRWELHRVWVVEATLKPGKRHIFPRRIIYLDEDTWTGVASDNYDSRGQLHRSGISFIVQNYDYPAPWLNYLIYDHNTKQYTQDAYLTPGSGVLPGRSMPENMWNPDSLAGQGIR